MKIIFAEDDLVSFLILKDYFKKWNYDFIGTKNGEEAFELLKKDDCPKIALLDWMMPVMSGIDVIKKLTQLKLKYPVYKLIVTAKNDNESMIEGLQAGASDFIKKPYNPSILKARIEVGFRDLEMNEKILKYSQKMEQLAEVRAKQLIHTDRLATIGILSSGIAHEINNPNSFISVNIQLLEDFWESIDETIKSAPESDVKTKAMNISEEMPNILSDMKSGVKRIKTIVDSLKKYYKSDEKIKMELSDINEIINESIKLCHNKLKNNISLNISIAEDLPQIKVNKQEIEQVIINILLNAADAMKNQSEKIITINVSSDNNYQIISIKDTGKGISEKNFKNMFKQFFTTKGKSNGTGMGLSISQNIIENHNGKIIPQRTENGGMEFIIRLPFKHN